MYLRKRSSATFLKGVDDLNTRKLFKNRKNIKRRKTDNFFTRLVYNNNIENLFDIAR